MPICTTAISRRVNPIVRIYEDFDKMSAKEVYYNDNGEKVVVKLLHNDNSVTPSAACNNIDDAHQTIEPIVVVTTIPNQKLPKSPHIASATRCPAVSPDATKSKRSYHRKTSDVRKRSSASNLFKCGGGGKTEPHQSCSSEDISPQPKPLETIDLRALPTSSSVRRSHMSVATANLRRQILTRQSPVDRTAAINAASALLIDDDGFSSGYTQYQMSLLAVPMPRDYGDASSDDLSSEWDSDVPIERTPSLKVYLQF